MDIFLRIESIEFSDKLDAEHKIMSLKKKKKKPERTKWPFAEM